MLFITLFPIHFKLYILYCNALLIGIRLAILARQSSVLFSRDISSNDDNFAFYLSFAHDIYMDVSRISVSEEGEREAKMYFLTKLINYGDQIS